MGCFQIGAAMNEYEKTAREAVGYIESCARKGIAPLIYDADVLRTRLMLADGHKQDEGKELRSRDGIR